MSTELDAAILSLRELLAAATPGEWRWTLDAYGDALVVEGAGAIFTPQNFMPGDTKADADSALIVALHNLAPRILEALEAGARLASALQVLHLSVGWEDAVEIGAAVTEHEEAERALLRVYGREVGP